MKNSIYKKCFFTSVFILVASAGIFAQSVSSEQRIVGTWTGGYDHWGIYGRDGLERGITIVFNSNGTGIFQGENITYGISANKLIIYYERFNASVFEYFFSPNGTLFLYKINYIEGHSQEVGMIMFGETVYILQKR